MTEASLAPAGRPETSAAAVRAADLLWLALAVLLLVGSGIGLRDPWPADEPRFALIARDMVLSGNWLFPHVGGELYEDKPPFFFWLLSAAYALTGSIRWSFLLPSFLAAFGTMWLVHDLARRLFGRPAALAAALTLAVTLQFTLATRAAQIDATLCFLMTLSLYGLLRHLLLGPAWGWYFVGGLAAGLGVITKGVGFLPLLVLIPYALLRARGFDRLPRFAGGGRWTLAAAGFLLGVAVWLVPMLATVAASDRADLVAYRDAILFQQTLERYASAWHHVKPWHYFLVEVVPALWLPFSALLFWLVPRWRTAWRERDARVLLPLLWVGIVLTFFSLSSGKRGIYILPALPALALAAAAYLPELYRRRGVERLSGALAAVLVLVTAAILAGQLAGWARIAEVAARTGLDTWVPTALLSGAVLLATLTAWWRQPILAWPAALAAAALAFSFAIAPRIDAERSGRAFTHAMLEQVPSGSALGLVGYKEQFLLYLDRPIVNFGHRRWLEGEREAQDAARWLNAAPNRVLLIPQGQLEPCFTDSPRRVAGTSARETWLLVQAPAARACAERGEPRNVRAYRRPGPAPTGAG